MRNLVIALTIFFSVCHSISAASLDARTTGGFLAGTKVLANDGEAFNEIDELMSGWYIQSFDTQSSSNEERKVVETFSHYSDSIYKLCFKGIDEEINLSYDQVVLVKKPFDAYDWVRAEELKAGDLIVSNNGPVIVDKNEKIKDMDDELVWNIELESLHTFYVGEKAQILVHNAAFVIPIVTYVIGSEVVYASASVAAAAIATYLIDDAVEKNKRANGIYGTGSNSTQDYRMPTNVYQRVYEPGTQLDLDRFSDTVTRPGRPSVRRDPKTKEYLEKDRAANSGVGGHGGSHWKLKDRNGNTSATVSEEGKIIRSRKK